VNNTKSEADIINKCDGNLAGRRALSTFSLTFPLRRVSMLLGLFVLAKVLARFGNVPSIQYAFTGLLIHLTQGTAMGVFA